MVMLHADRPTDAPVRHSGARSVAASGSLPPHALLILSIISVQLGSALAIGIFPEVGPIGFAFLNSTVAAVTIGALARPSLGLAWRHIRLVLLFGLVNAIMILGYYTSLQRIPLGIAATIGFLGPLSVGIATSRHLLDLFWTLLAASGVLLLMPELGHQLDPLGLAEAFLSAIGWAGYVVVSQRAARLFPGNSALALGLGVCAVLLLPAALTEGKLPTASHISLLAALAVSVLSSLIPHMLEFAALRRMSARSYGVLVTLEPAAAAIVGAMTLDQQLSSGAVVAITFITLSSLGVALFDFRR